MTTDLTHPQMNVFNPGSSTSFSAKLTRYRRFVASNFVVSGGHLVETRRIYKMFRSFSAAFSTQRRT